MTKKDTRFPAVENKSLTRFTTPEGETYEFTPQPSEAGEAMGNMFIRMPMRLGMTSMFSSEFDKAVENGEMTAEDLATLRGGFCVAAKSAPGQIKDGDAMEDGFECTRVEPVQE